MIIVKNRELLIPANERYIGTPLDNETDIRQFRMDRFSQNGFDLSNLTFRLDMKYPETRKVYTFDATTSRAGRSVVVMTQHYTAAYPNAGTVTFTFDGTNWNDGDQDVDLAEIGISIAFTPNEDDTITVVTTTANVDTDTVLLAKEVHDDYLVLTWEVSAAQTSVPGTVFAGLRGSDENGDQRYASFPGVFYSEKNIYSPENYTGNLSELEQLENQLVSALRRAEYLSQNYDDLETAIEDAEAWARGTRGGVAVGSSDETYHNNSKYFRQYAERFARGTEDGNAVSSGDGYLDNAHYWKQQGERYAVGKEDGTDVTSGNGYHDNSKYYAEQSDIAGEKWSRGTVDNVPVGSDDETYHNNAKYYSEQSDGYSNVSEAYAKGTVDGTAVTSGQTGYHDNAKYYKEQVQSRLNQIDTNTSNINAEASARAAADAVLQGQIDNFVQLPSGSTTADAELLNIRVGADGVTYPTAGDAVRANDSNLKSQIGQFMGTPTLTTGGYILNDGKLYTNGGANDRYTTFIPVKKGNLIEVFAKGNSNTNALSFYYTSAESGYAEGVANNQSSHFFYNVTQDGYVRFYFTVTAEQLSTVTIIIYTSADVYADALRKLNNTGHDVLPYTFRFGYWQNQTYHFDLAHYCTSELITVPTDIDIYAAEGMRCNWDLIEDGSYITTYGITSSNSPRTIPSGTYYVTVSKTNGANMSIDDIRFGMTVGTDVLNKILDLYEYQTELRFNEMFSRQASLSLGNYPNFQVSGTSIIITFSGNVFVTKKASANAIIVYNDLGGSYTVPTNSYCVINMTEEEVQSLTTAELFSSSDEFVVLFYNNYGYPKFCWEKYWNPYQIDLRFNERFSRQAALALGNTPKFQVNGTSIIITFSGNVFITKQLSANTLYNFNNLGGTYTVPASSYCVINITVGAVQVLTTAELFASMDEIVVLFFNHYGYPKFGWEKYWIEQRIRENVYNDLTAYPYEGEKISFDPVLTYDRVLSLSKGYSQGGACYGDYLFQFHSQNQVSDADFHGCTVANLTSREEIQFIDLGYDVSIHNNNASFSAVKYSNGDAFPLLYVSQENADARKILVYRVTGNEPIYALNVVQTIMVPASSEWSVTYPNACVGDDGYLYIVGYKSDNKYEILKYSLPDISASAVQLSYADAISSVIIEIDTNLQGFMVYSGKLYATAGASSYSIMDVFNLSNGSLLSKITFNNIGLPYEPEAIFLYNGVACITFAFNNCTIYRFAF